MKLEDFIKFVAEHDCIPVKRDTNFIARILFESLGSCAEFRCGGPHLVTPSDFIGEKEI